MKYEIPSNHLLTFCQVGFRETTLSFTSAHTYLLVYENVACQSHRFQTSISLLTFQCLIRQVHGQTFLWENFKATKYTHFKRFHSAQPWIVIKCQELNNWMAPERDNLAILVLRWHCIKLSILTGLRFWWICKSKVDITKRIWH